MDTFLQVLVGCLQERYSQKSQVIPWSSPVPSFGNVSRSKVATLGINPSNREFVDNCGKELTGMDRRFHTLASLGIESWCDANVHHLRLITESCFKYFDRNPYNGWFKRLDAVISGTRTSFYDDANSACHLDLVPHATACKWTDLNNEDRSALLDAAGNALGLLIRDSPIRLLILNGRYVVERFQDVAAVQLNKEMMPHWSLCKTGTREVFGFAYSGVVREISGVTLEQELLVLGFNHNIQSSFGVTNDVLRSIREWIATSTAEVICEA